MKLVFDQFLPASPGAVWPFISRPELMAQWSTALVTILAPGDSLDPASVGTMRQISIPSYPKPVAFDEVIEYSQAPNMLVYRVIDGLPIRYHRGEIKLTAAPGGTHLRWEVNYIFPIPGMAQVAKRVLQPQLKKSLRNLARVVVGAPEQTWEREREVDETADLPKLYADAGAILLEQRALADALTHTNDPKRWFVRVYEYVTECQINACRDGQFTHPAWVLRLIPRFHHYYQTNLLLYQGTEKGFPEQHWRSSFKAMHMAGKWQNDEMMEIGYGIAKGMQAHIEEDLPRTLAEIYQWYYKDKCEYARFRADYLLMNNIFRDAADKLKKLMPKPRRHFVTWTMDQMLPVEIKDAIMAKFYYDIVRERRKSFERGERLARLMNGS